MVPASGLWGDHSRSDDELGADLGELWGGVVRCEPSLGFSKAARVRPLRLDVLRMETSDMARQTFTPQHTDRS